ncbi:hypothetical protein ACS0TY_021367 [Phlomoides rotata]
MQRFCRRRDAAEEGRSAPEAAPSPAMVDEEDLPAAEDATPVQTFVRDPADRTFMDRDPRLFAKFSSAKPRPLPSVIDFLSSRRVATMAGLPFHMARSISDIPRAWNMDLEEMAMKETTNDCLYTSMILSQQANVMMRRGMNLRSADVDEYLTLRDERRRFEEERALGEAHIKSLEDNAAEQAAKTALELVEAEKRGRTAGLAEGERIREELAKEVADANSEMGRLQYGLTDARKEAAEAQTTVIEAKKSLEEIKLVVEGHLTQLGGQKRITDEAVAELGRVTASHSAYLADPTNQVPVAGNFAFCMAIADAVRSVAKSSPDLGIVLSWWPADVSLIRPQTGDENEEDDVDEEGNEGAEGHGEHIGGSEAGGGEEDPAN